MMGAEKKYTECSLCRPGGFHMTETLFSFIEPETYPEPLAVIDVGCGSGAALQYLKERYPDWELRGIDPDPQAPAGRPGLADEEESSSVRIQTGEAEQLPFPDGYADVILMECSFSKTWNPKQALREIRRVLKPDGWLLMSDIYARKEEITDRKGEDFETAAGMQEPDGSLEESRFEAGRRMSSSGMLGRLESHKTIWKRLRGAGFAVLEMQDVSEELVQWIGQKILDGGACEWYKNAGIDRQAVKRAGCGYFICAARPSGLWRTMDYAVENSSFYREICGKACADGMAGDGRRSFMPGDWESFWSLPFTGPENIRENPEAFVCVNPKEIARIITLQTSGSRGKPKRIFFTEQDLLRTADFFEKGMQYLIRPGDSVTVYMEGPGRFSVGGLMKEGLARIGSEVTVHGLIRDMKAAAADGEGRDCFVGVPGQMYGLAASAPGLRPKAVLLSADYVPESVKGFLEAAWKCRVYTHWGMTETGYGGGVQCGAREGCHLRDDDLLIEVLNPETGMPVGEGEYGELVLTTLRRRGMPLIRYRTGDLGRMLTEPCGCGCLKPRLDKVEGRLDDCMRLPGGRLLSMHILDELIFAVDGVQDFEAAVNWKNEWGSREETENNREERILRLSVMEKRGAKKEVVLWAVKKCLEEKYNGLLKIEVTGKKISPYIGSGKRRLKQTAF